MGQIGPDITFDELKKQNIESLRIISDLHDRLKKAEAKLVGVRKARKILYDWTQTDIVDAVEEVCEAVRILDSALDGGKGE